MAKMISVAPHYTNERLYKEGEVFEYDGPEGTAFHVVGGQPLTRESINESISKLRTKAGAPIGPGVTELNIQHQRDLSVVKAQADAKEKTIAELQAIIDQNSWKDKRIAELEAQLHLGKHPEEQAQADAAQKKPDTEAKRKADEEAKRQAEAEAAKRK